MEATSTGKIFDSQEMGDNEEMAYGDCVRDYRLQEALYFKMYARLEVQEWLLKDSARNRAYRSAIRCNAAAFKDKTVLDVGCGLGTLSLFAAESGAHRVIAVEAASIAEYTRSIVLDNSYAAVITVIRGKVEEIELPEGIEKVDIILCDWMGHCLFSENMLESLIFARDKWLAPGGLIFPDSAQLYLGAISGQEGEVDQDLDQWNDLYDIDMGAIRRSCECTAVVAHVDARQMMSKVVLVKSLDLYTAPRQSCFTRCHYELKVTRSGQVHAFFAYFDVGFGKSPNRVCLSTSPQALWTHWNQTVFHMKSPLTVGPEETIRGMFSIKPSLKNIYGLEFDINFEHKGKEKSMRAKQSFFLDYFLPQGLS
ncbi:GL16439 [Drosophila persimilis]|uniref:type I protein arginine methyltransferase n=2 Tax=Drosophila persimilis TaxID=7234 RepID=B4GQQ4_DROPE|nr:GL16439 [Drosophila persimilis]